MLIVTTKHNDMSNILMIPAVVIITFIKSSCNSFSMFAAIR